VTVEGCGAPDDGHYAVGSRELEELLDIGVGHTVREHAQTGLRLKFG
jgi:hypothetical protein